MSVKKSNILIEMKNINMKTWYSLHLGDAIMAHQPSEQIREAFEEFILKNGTSKELAVFTRNESEGRLHCEVTAYFSPAAGQLAKLFDVTPCEKPNRANLDLLIGDETCWAELFP